MGGSIPSLQPCTAGVPGLAGEGEIRMECEKAEAEVGDG